MLSMVITGKYSQTFKISDSNYYHMAWKSTSFVFCFYCTYVDLTIYDTYTVIINKAFIKWKEMKIITRGGVKCIVCF